jgi:diaminopimelate epimerase
MSIGFVKMSGAGNDFIAVDNRDGSLNGLLDADTIRGLCRRGLSVGADGLLELVPDRELRFRMKYYNSDGHAAEMCGNGGRCISVFAAGLGLVETGEEFSFRSDAGVHKAMVLSGDSARIWMTEPEVHFLNRQLTLDGSSVRVSLVDTGVPHAVVMADVPGTPPFPDAAPLIRRHQLFGAPGANVDYIWSSGEDLVLRTWERGVEGETLACGTGAVACAVCADRLLGITPPISFRVRSGLVLTVGIDGHGWWLQGEARRVYSGILCDLPVKSLTEES